MARSMRSSALVCRNLQLCLRQFVWCPGLDGQGVTHCAHPGSGTTTARIAGDGGNRRGCIRVGAIRWVIALREGRRRHHGRVHVLGLSRHERDLVAELAVRRVVQRIGDERAGEIERIRVDRTRIVHARDHHRGCVPGRIRWVDLPRRVNSSHRRIPTGRYRCGKPHFH